MKKIPFEFILDHLFQLSPLVKPMFGCHAIYIGEKIFLILRDRKDHPDANGIWIATSSEHHKSLKKEIPSLKAIDILSEGKGETNWQMVSNENEHFEDSAIKICDLILRGDERVGKIPKTKAGQRKK
mgnify:CR=1 FL=1